MVILDQKHHTFLQREENIPKSKKKTNYFGELLYSVWAESVSLSAVR